MIEAIVYLEFMRNSLYAGILIGFLAPLMGVFLVVKRLSMMADALSHITLSGIPLSLLLGKMLGSTIALFANLNPIYMGMLFSVVGALLIEKLRYSYKHYEELAIPIMMSAGIGLGIVFISLANGFNTSLLNYLFGSLNAVRKVDVWVIAVIFIVVVLFILLLFKELFSLSFDADHAKTTGISGKLLNLIFIVLVALVVAVSMRVVGILLVSALMVLPVATSMKLATSFKQSILYAIIIGQISVLTGIYVAYHLDLAPGGTIVVTSFLIFCLVLLIKKIVKYVFLPSFSKVEQSK
jgi:zinc transport system permease protein